MNRIGHRVLETIMKVSRSVFFLLALIAAASVASAGSLIESVQTGNVAGLAYSISPGSFRNDSFSPLPDGFRYRSSSWIGTSSLSVICKGGRLFINGRDVAPISAGDRIAISDESVLLNGALQK